MITLRDLFDVTCTITRVEVTARDVNLIFLHRFWIGKGCNRDHLPHGMVNEWTAGRLSLSDRKINTHGETKKNRQPESGWGLKDGALPPELLDAEIVHLGMRCRDGIEYEVYADVVSTVMAVEMLKKHMEG